MGHLERLSHALQRTRGRTATIDRWGHTLAQVLGSGGRLLACGNGGSAAEAQHLTGELVGKFRDDRTPLSAIALHADTSAATAIGNDYGAAEIYARQVRAHGRAGDVFVGLSTSGSSENVCAAAKAARSAGLVTWALTGPAPNSLESICDDALPVDAPDTATVQEVHLAVVHAVCAALDAELGRRDVELGWDEVELG
ncbi:D-sedoheptulose-7-phosphate isomerase [Prauserella aidingensis]|uniref:D-sedoheptulose-7-phosphate isomerase n=1 Tax=Prauserella aidingensis TaxID=387890 RepID=UPI003557A22C